MSDPREWVKLYGDYLYRYAFARIHESPAAEDLVQETFLAALKGVQRFEGRSSEKTWLTSILKHKIIDHMRRKSRERPSEVTTGGSDINGEFFDKKGDWKWRPGKWAMDQLKAIEEKEFWKTLSKCLTELPGRLSQIFVLREMDGMSTEEICSLLDITSANCWVMLHRARIHLRHCLETNWFHA